MSERERLKRKLPLSALKALVFEKNPNLKRVTPIEGNKFIVRFEETDDFSDFFFEIERFERTNNGDGYHCIWKPRDAHHVEERKSWVKQNALISILNSWVDVISGYHEITDTPFDDPILKAHKEWFLQQLELVETDNDEPFAVNQILLILDHYEKLQGELRKLEGVSEEEIQELIQEIEMEKRTLGSSPKRQSFDSMLTIWARIAKKYPTVLKFIIDTFNAWGLNQVFENVLKSIGGG